MIFHVQDEEDRAIAAACKESLKNVSQLYKEVDASQGAPSLDLRKHSKATTSLEAFLVMHILQLTGFVFFISRRLQANKCFISNHRIL